MKRGEIYWVEFDPARGGEITKRRPAIIVSNDRANAALNRVQVVSVTGNITRIYDWEAPVQIGPRGGKALADQIRTVAKQRILDYVGDVTSLEMRRLERAIKV